MSKDLARGPQSYLNEQRVLEIVPELLRAKGFESVHLQKRKGIKLLSAKTAAGESVAFWLKQGWTNTKRFSAIQFGMFPEEANPKSQPDSFFIEFVAALTVRVKQQGATHALLVHMVDSKIRNYVALRIDDVVKAYRRQIRDWPNRARNTKTPTLWFEDSRDLPDAASARAVIDLEIPLEEISGFNPDAEISLDGQGSKKVTAEMERRLKQQLFRARVGDLYGWRCALSGTSVRDVLEAAHLPGRDWRVANEASDGVLLRADLHRLLDRGIAEIRGNIFVIIDQKRAGEYIAYDGKIITMR